MKRDQVFAEIKIERVHLDKFRKTLQWLLVTDLYRVKPGVLDAKRIGGKKVVLWQGASSHVPKWVEVVYGKLREKLGDEALVIIQEDGE